MPPIAVESPQCGQCGVAFGVTERGICDCTATPPQVTLLSGRRGVAVRSPSGVPGVLFEYRNLQL